MWPLSRLPFSRFLWFGQAAPGSHSFGTRPASSSSTATEIAMKTLRDDTTATSQVIGAVVMAALTVTVLGGGYVATQERVEQEYAPTETVEQSSIEATSTDQLKIKPLVGDDVDLNNTKVKVTFKDRNAPPAVLYNAGKAKQQSAAVATRVNKTVSTGGNYTAVNETVTYYEQNGTTDEVELTRYKWEKTETYETVKKSDGDPVRRWEIVVNDVGPWGGESYSHTTHCEATYKTYGECDQKFDSIADDDDQSIEDFYPISYVMTTKTKTYTHKSPVHPGGEWTKVKALGKQSYDLENPKPIYEKRNKTVTVGYNASDTTTTVTETRPVYVATNETTSTSNGPTGVDPKAATRTLGLDDDAEFDEVNAAASLDADADADTDADADDDADADADADADVTAAGASDTVPAEQAITNAADEASFLVGEETNGTQNSAIGAGGSAGSKQPGTWVQGETIFVQLDRPLLFEGDRVRVQIIEQGSNSEVLDRTIRVQNPETFSFAPDGTEATEKLPATPDRNISIDPPSVDPGDGGNYSISPPDDVGDGTVGGGGGDGGDGGDGIVGGGGGGGGDGGTGDGGTPTTDDDPTVDVGNSDEGVGEDEDDEFKFIPDAQDAQLDIKYEIEGEPNPERSVPAEIDEFVGGAGSYDYGTSDEDDDPDVFSDDDDDDPSYGNDDGGSSDYNYGAGDPTGPGLSL